MFDATPPIYLAKIEQGYSYARRIEHAAENAVFEIHTVEETTLTSRLQTNSNLSAADVAVLTCAASHDGVAVIGSSGPFPVQPRLRYYGGVTSSRRERMVFVGFRNER